MMEMRIVKGAQLEDKMGKMQEGNYQLKPSKLYWN